MSVLVYNGCSSEEIQWQIIIPGSPPQMGLVAAAGQAAVPIPDGASAMGFVGFSGDAYLSAPGTNIGPNDAFLAGVDRGGTPPGLAAPQNSGGLALLFDATSVNATWTAQTSDIGPLSGPVPAGGGAPIALDSDVTWVGFTGFAGDMYMALAGVPPGYQVMLVLCDSSATETEVHEAFRKAGAA
jgi:hypothetical protein